MEHNRVTESRFLCLAGHLKTHNGNLTAQLASNIPVITANQWWKQHQRKKIHDGEISYYDSDPTQTTSKRAVVFLHGNPTSSYLWRGVIPRVEGVARCLAPDLIGMGRSSKLARSMYTFADHYKYLNEWFESMNLPRKLSQCFIATFLITIVCHDWGSGLGLHWAHQHQDRIEGLVYMEGLLIVPPSLDMFPPQAQKTFGDLRSNAGEEIVIKNNFFRRENASKFHHKETTQR
ncbi:putative renilla-luciferin 2-monooxygenase [Apostichopus japonicus]|uniref:Putative renilla-luciferin 2-monooxygenase n=1 Tax=Stichopus japonicus TaxID=307972 RepID=A0A2G8JBD4_STIJA|nr:putative renilla-luciferin 2-monooxygenase [Apostichopus japonicus]PIK33043.1 putative renilla-luciferin 2-monooxygenase [Apostichopus japonicus]